MKATLPKGVATLVVLASLFATVPPVVKWARSATYSLRQVETDSQERPFREELTADLMRLVEFQDQAFAEEGQYPVDPHAAGFLPHPDVTIATSSYGHTGWAATGTHSRLSPFVKCAVWVGNGSTLDHARLPGGQTTGTPRTVKCTWEAGPDTDG